MPLALATRGAAGRAGSNVVCGVRFPLGCSKMPETVESAAVDPDFASTIRDAPHPMTAPVTMMATPAAMAFDFVVMVLLQFPGRGSGAHGAHQHSSGSPGIRRAPPGIPQEG